MRRLLPALAAAAACAGASSREPACAAPAERVEIRLIQVGWNVIDPGGQSLDLMTRPRRDPRQAEALASHLLDQCRKGAAMERLQDSYSDVPGGTLVVGPQAEVPFKGVALCLQKDECALVRSETAFHVLKRID
ncbi:MAG TPA: hypothetical protein VMK66_21020 [Myxococcales bacterium]|nr:hypothetical protein [Myxococcales bacterium]